MSKQQIEILFAYTSHTTQQLFSKAALLDDAGYHANPGYGHGSIHDLFFHMLATARAWRVALESGTQPPRLPADQFPTLAAVREGFEQEREAWRSLMDGLSEEQVNGPITLTTARGETVSFEIWRILHHLILHAMQHHTEIANLLTSKGQSPGDIDFLFYQG